MTSTSGSANVAAARRSPAQLAALVSAVAFLLVGLGGFIPGLTTNYGSLEFAGHQSGALLLGVFQVSILHNIVHLLFAVAGLVMARTASRAKAFLVAGGVIYLILWVYGLIIDHGSSANFVPLNSADNWLHLVLAVGMVGLGLLLRPRAKS